MNQAGGTEKVKRPSGFVRQAGALIVSGAAAKALFFLAGILVTRSLSKAENGQVQLGLWLATLFAYLPELGLRGWVAREAAKARDDRERVRELVWMTFWLRMATILIVAPLPFILLPLLGYTDAVSVLTGCFLVYTSLDSMSMVLKASCRGLGSVRADAVFSVVGRLVGLCLVALCLHYSRHGLSIAAAYGLSATVEVIGLLLWINRQSGLTYIRPQLDVMGKILKAALPLAGVSALAILQSRTPGVILSKVEALRQLVEPWIGQRPHWDGVREIAVLSVAGKLPEALLFLPIAAMNALIPRLARLNREHDAVHLQETLVQCVRYTAVGGAVIAFWLVLGADVVIRIVANREYYQDVAAFQFAGLGLFFTFVNYATANILLALGFEHALLRRMTIVWILGGVMAAGLAPAYGAVGAIVGVMMVEATGSIQDMTVLRRRGIAIPWRSLGETWIVALSAVAAWYSTHTWAAPYRVTVALAVTGLALWVCLPALKLSKARSR